MKSIKIFSAFLLACFVLFTSCEKDEDNSVTESFNSLTIPAAGYWLGTDETESFLANGIIFPYAHNSGFWNGFVYSQKHDVKTAGFLNQYSSYAMKDTASNNIFVVAYPSSTANTIEFDNTVYDVRCKITNTTYAALSMKTGDAFAKKFGGTTGNDKDWFKVQLIGFDQNNQPTDTVDFYLADYRFDNNSQDYIVSDWKPVSLDKLGKIKKLKVELSSTDNGDWGMNTPGYFCLDDIEYKPVAKTE